MSDYIKQQGVEKSCVSADSGIASARRSAEMNEERLDMSSGYIGGDEWSLSTSNALSTDSSVRGPTGRHLVPQVVTIRVDSVSPAATDDPVLATEGGGDTDDLEDGRVNQAVEVATDEDRGSTTGDAGEDTFEEVQSNLKRHRVYAYGRSMHPRRH